MGDAEGKEDGIEDGKFDGIDDGANDGTDDGTNDGENDGESVGENDGDMVGFAEGAGVLTGLFVGTSFLFPCNDLSISCGWKYAIRRTAPPCLFLMLKVVVGDIFFPSLFGDITTLSDKTSSVIDAISVMIIVKLKHCWPPPQPHRQWPEKVDDDLMMLL